MNSGLEGLTTLTNLQYELEVPTPPTNNKLATLAQEWPAHSSPRKIIQRD